MGTISPISFRKKLLTWSEEHPRYLPWTNISDPYAIWISEVVLQQTRAEQAIPYFHKLMKSFPTLAHLANSSLDDLLLIWEGLGYYSRARNLYKAAKWIQVELNGVFPNSYSEILKLPGVGDYTAAAIASFAFKLAFPVVDGNVVRVLGRLFGVETSFHSTEGRKQFYQLANQFLDQKVPDLYNQAIMDFGATHCLPSNPLCHSCPFQLHCTAYKIGRIQDFPVKKSRQKSSEKFLHYFLIQDLQDRILIRQRDDASIWKNLFELPGLFLDQEKTLTSQQIKKYIRQCGIEINNYKILKIRQYHHLLTHLKLNIKFYIIYCDSLKDQITNNKNQMVEIKTLSKYAFPKIIRLFLDQNLNRRHVK